MGPDAGDAALGEFLDIRVGHLLPLVDHQRVEPRIVGTHAGGNVEERLRFVQIVQHRGVEIEEGGHHGFAELEGHADAVAVVIVRHVFAPVDQVGRGLAGEGLAIVVDVDLAVAAIHFGGGGEEHDGVLADVADVGRFLDGQAVGQFHEHFGRAGFGGVNAARCPIKRQGFGGKFFGLGGGRFARVGEARGKVLVVIELGDVGFVGDGHQQDFASLFGVADDERLHAPGSLFQFPHVAVDVLGIGELIGCTDGVAEHLFRGGHGVGRG